MDAREIVRTISSERLYPIQRPLAAALAGTAVAILGVDRLGRCRVPAADLIDHRRAEANDGHYDARGYNRITTQAGGEIGMKADKVCAAK